MTLSYQYTIIFRDCKGFFNGLLGTGLVYIYATGLLDLNGHSQTLAGVVGGGMITNTSASPALLILNQTGGTSTFDAQLDPGRSGNVYITKTGPGTLYCPGSGMYAGPLTVSQGILWVDSPTAFSTNAELDLSAPASLRLGNNVVLTTPIVLHPGVGGNEFLAASTTGNATLAGNITVDPIPADTQYRLGCSSWTLTLTGTSTIPAGVPAAITRVRVVLTDHGAINAASGLTLGGPLNFTISGDAVISTLTPAGTDGLRILAQGAWSGGTMGYLSNSFVIQDRAFISVGQNGAGTFNLAYFELGDTLGSMQTLSLAGGSLKLGGFTTTDPRTEGAAVGLNGTTIIAGADNPAFLPASVVKASVLAGGAIFDVNGHNINIAAPLNSSTATDGGLTVLASSPGTMTLGGYNTYRGTTTIQSNAVLVVDSNDKLGAPVASITFNGGTLRTTASFPLDNSAQDPEGLTHNYTFNDGTANDSVGSANGALAGGASISNGQLVLTGVPQIKLVTLPASSININTYSAITINCWFAMAYSSTTSNVWAELFSFGATDPNSAGYAYLMANVRDGRNGGLTRAVISNATQGIFMPALLNYETVAEGPIPIADTAEHLCTVTVDASTINYFLDGVLQATTPLGTSNGGTSIASISNQLAYIGGSAWKSDPSLAGTIDQLSIFNRELSSSEILACYNSGPTTSIGGTIVPRNIALSAAGGGIDLPNANTLTVSGTISGLGPLHLTGTGTLIVTGSSDYSGNTSIDPSATLRYSGSVSHSIGAVSGTGTLLVDQGTTLTSDGVNMLNGTWTINGTQIIRSSGTAGAYANHYLGPDSTILSGTSVTSNLTFGAGAKLDLQNNALIVQATSANLSTLLTQIATDVTQGYITSSTAAANPAYQLVVAVDNANIHASNFGGVPVNANSIIVTEALKGDANLDGYVDLNDFNIWLSNLGISSSAYSASTGDLNNDGYVDLSDFNLWLSSLGHNAGANPAPAIASGASLPGGAASTGGAAATPEPASLALLGLGALGLLSRRRSARP